MNALATIEDEAWDDEQFVPGSHAALVNAVILKAVTDLFSANVPETDRADAFAFLTADTGSWAESRAHLCWLVDLDPDLMRARIWDILNGNRDVSSLTRRGIPTLDAEHGRKHLAVVRQQEEAAKAAARVQAERARERREREAVIQEAMDRQAREELEEERRIFEQRLKAAETEAGLRPQQRRKVAKAEYVEREGIPLGHLLRIDDPWEPGTYCTFLGTLLPSKSNSMGRAVAAACSEHGFVLEHHTRYNLDSLRLAASMLKVDLLYLDADGNPVSYSSDAVTARLRLRHPQLAA